MKAAGTGTGVLASRRSRAPRGAGAQPVLASRLSWRSKGAPRGVGATSKGALPRVEAKVPGSTRGRGRADGSHGASGSEEAQWERESHTESWCGLTRLWTEDDVGLDLLERKTAGSGGLVEGPCQAQRTRGSEEGCGLG